MCFKNSMMMYHFVCLIAILNLIDVGNGELEEVYRWQKITYTSNCENPAFIFVEDGEVLSTNNQAYVPENNIPMGVSHYKGRLFITMPRRRPGVVSTLNVINMENTANNLSPKLTAYPTCAANRLQMGSNYNHSIISVYRTRVDACDRLWFVDTGLLEYPNNRQQIQRPSIWVIDLKTNKMLRRFVIPESSGALSQGLASITVDVDAESCDDAFAYVPDLAGNRLHVYSFRANQLWTFRHNYFSFDPMHGDFDVAGLRYQWDDGIFSVALGPKGPDGFRTAYFHPMASISEFAVSTKVLQNQAATTLPSHLQGFAFVGSRGSGSQSAMYDYDPKTGVMFYSEVGRNSIACWNTKNQLSPETCGNVAQNNETMIYPSDLQVDASGTLWAMTNSLPIFVYSTLDLQTYNFRVWRQSTSNAIEGTICQ